MAVRFYRGAMMFGLLLLPHMALATPTCASEDGGGGGPFTGQCTAQPASFIQTLKKVRLMKLDGSTVTFVDTGGTTQDYDFASVSAGATLGDFIGNADLPDGTYVGISPVIDNMATLKASVVVDGMSCHTSASGFVPVPGTAQDYTYDFTVGSPFSSGTDAGYNYGAASDMEQWLNGDGDLVIAKKFSAPIVIDSTNQPDTTIDIAFDVAQAAVFSFASGDCSEVSLGELGATFTVTSN